MPQPGRVPVKELLGNIRAHSDVDNAIHKPILYRLSSNDEVEQLRSLLSSSDRLEVIDTYYDQLVELQKCLNPQLKTPEECDLAIQNYLNGQSIEEVGTWVYYPWNSRLIKVLPEAEFIQVRTNRNKYKISPEEQSLLQQKRIGLIGLSVGKEVAMTLAMERSFGELRLADFDTLELSNLNRIRTGLHTLGKLKAVTVAREI
ncbi:MAG: ThiF family adenylyltransferase, partial [Bacteroidota bacterium]